VHWFSQGVFEAKGFEPRGQTHLVAKVGTSIREPLGPITSIPEVSTRRVWRLPRSMLTASKAIFQRRSLSSDGFTNARF
jgi:hypothetical protein